jgi:hypothetical protein
VTPFAFSRNIPQLRRLESQRPSNNELLIGYGLFIERLSWGRANLQDAGEVRRRYIAALHAADNHDIVPLLAFARS